MLSLNEIKKRMKDKYPDSTIVTNLENDCFEVLCEVEPANDHSIRSKALVYIGKSPKHIHKVTTEVYKVIKGAMELYVGDEMFVLKKDQDFTIKPGEKHHAESRAGCWFWTYSTPGWTLEDHILV